MVDYSKLAYEAKRIQDADRVSAQRSKESRGFPRAFFEKVKAHVVTEMNKANVELHKRGAAIIDWNHLPGFEEEIFLTYGTDSLCRVGLGIEEGGCRLTAVICGPPNGYEIARKEYFCDQEAICPEAPKDGAAQTPAFESLPREIAVNIISSILVGRFD